MRIVVVGGGVIGLCIAEALLCHDVTVTVVDAGSFGAGASAGNTGWVTPGVSNPLPAPGTVSQAMRWMLSPTSPLLVRPNARVSFARWLYDFWRSSDIRRYSAGMAAMVALTCRTPDDFDALAARCSFEMHSRGLLFVGHSKAALDAELAVLQDQQKLGYAGEISPLTSAEALDQEPALSPNVAGAIYAPAERHVRPETLTSGLIGRLRDGGVTLFEQTEVKGIFLERGTGWRLASDGPTITADRVIIASGVASAKLLEPLGINLPLEGGKGYSITLDDPPVKLRSAVYLLEAKVGVSPYDNALRLAGTMELGTRGLKVNRGRVGAIEDAARRSFRHLGSDLPWRPWAGQRPLLPDGLPAIGAVPGWPGLFVATGHAMLGVTLAPTTAALLAPTVLGDKPSLELAPFSIARFGNRGRNSVGRRIPRGA